MEGDSVEVMPEYYGPEMLKSEKRSQFEGNGPCRETAQTMLHRLISTLRRKADGLEAILKKLGDEVGTPAECEMWEVLCAARARGY